jgi:signal transduction histidine kinase
MLNAQIEESKVKAGLIFSFAQFVTWENEATFKTFDIYLMSEDTAMLTEFKRNEKTHKLREKPVRVYIINSMDQIKNPQLLFLDEEFEKNINEVQFENEKSKVLLVTYNLNNRLLSMINMIKDKKKHSKITFEVNRQNIDAWGFTYDPDLLFYGGTLLDVKELYMKTSKELTEKSIMLEHLNRDMMHLEIEKNNYEEELITMNQLLDTLLKEVNLKEMEYLNLNKDVNAKDEILKQMNRVLNRNIIQNEQLKDDLQEQQDSIQNSRNELKFLNSALTNKLLLIEQNQTLIDSQKIQIQSQKKGLLLAVFLAFTLVIAVIAIFIALKAKKNMNLRLRFLVEQRTLDLKTSQEFYHSLFENSPVAIVEFDMSKIYAHLIQLPNTKEKYSHIFSDSFYTELLSKVAINDLNMQALLLYGVANKEEYIKRYAELFTLESNKGLNELYVNMANGRKQFDYEIIRSSLKGDRKHILHSFVVLPGHEKDYSKVLISMLDITELKTYEKEILKHRDHLEELVQERTREIIKLNEDLYHANEALQSKNEDLSGKNKQLKAQQNEISDLNDELLGINKLLEDRKAALEQMLQKLKETQVQLVESEKMASLGMLTAGVAHEINNPINFISSGNQALEMIVEELWDKLDALKACENMEATAIKEKIKAINGKIEEAGYKAMFDEIINGINLGVNRTVEIVRSLQTYSSQSGDKAEIVNLLEVIENSLLILKNKYEGRIELIKNVDSAIVLNCPMGKISQVCMNLLANAFDAIETKGTVKIDANVQANKISIEISDSGSGMDEQTLKQLFDPFFTTKEVGKGTGLGMYITYGIIQQLNGSIQVSSKPGMGTKIQLFLPV